MSLSYSNSQGNSIEVGWEPHHSSLILHLTFILSCSSKLMDDNLLKDFDPFFSQFVFRNYLLMNHLFLIAIFSCLLSFFHEVKYEVFDAENPINQHFFFHLPLPNHYCISL